MAIIDEIEDEGVLEEQERDLVKSALEFDETVVDEIITHRVDVIAVDVNEDIETVKETFINEEYSRLPVYEGSIDHIIGFVSQKDFFKKYLTKKDDETFLLRDIMQEIHYVPHLMKISDIMKQMQKDKVHMAVVLDQYGGTLGIVTLEDILEQLVGEIWDENDEIIAPVTFVSENEFNVNGDVSLTAFKRYWHNRTGDSPKIDGNAKTVGGWVLELFGKIPETNESVTTDDFRITVLKVSERRIVKVRLTVIPKSEKIRNNMRVLFIVCAVLGTVGICGLLVMLLFFRLKINLGFRLPKGRTIPIEQFIPQGIYGYAVFTAVFGYFGLMLLQLSLPWYFIVPADIAMGFIVNFIGMHFLSPAVKSFVNGKAPKPDDLTGYEAVALENIAGSGYGKVRVKYNGLNYRFDAISVYHTDIESGEKRSI